MASESVFEPLRSVAKVGSGFAFKNDDAGKACIPGINIKNITPPTIDTTDCERVPSTVIFVQQRGTRHARHRELRTGDSPYGTIVEATCSPLAKGSLQDSL
jgi:hypothetical protein